MCSQVSNINFDYEEKNKFNAKNGGAWIYTVASLAVTSTYWASVSPASGRRPRHREHGIRKTSFYSTVKNMALEKPPSTAQWTWPTTNGLLQGKNVLKIVFVVLNYCKQRQRLQKNTMTRDCISQNNEGSPSMFNQ